MMGMLKLLLALACLLLVMCVRNSGQVHPSRDSRAVHRPETHAVLVLYVCLAVVHELYCSLLGA